MRSKGQITIARNPDRKPTGGATAPARQTTPAQPKKPAARLKLTVRRLPPGLTETEFFTVLGDEWRPGNGKVDWFRYCMGKLKGAADHPRQTCAYLRVTAEAHIKLFETAFLSSTFHDAKGTHRDPNLTHLLPRVGFAPCQRIPNSRQRADVRQGTIDQDPKFQAFLAGLTEPIVKPAPVDGTAAAEASREKVSTTPLIEALREKKSTKAKAAANRVAKNAKDEKPADKRPATTKARPTNADVAKAAASVKVGKSVPEKVGKGSKQAQTPARSTETAPTATPARAERRRGRPQGDIAAMLKKDLGLTKPERKGAKGTKVDNTAASTEPSEQPPPVMTAPPSATKGQPSQPTRSDQAKGEASAPAASTKGPKRERNAKSGKGKDNTTADPIEQTGAAPVEPSSVKTTKNNATARSANAPKAIADSTQAFVKHANSSQGITEANLTQALSKFGVVSVSINADKGTAMARFKTNEDLKAAVMQKKIAVGQGAVELTEFKDRSAGNKRAPRRGPAARGGQATGAGRTVSAASSASLPSTAKQAADNTKSADAT